jgi:hypothetical protein
LQVPGGRLSCTGLPLSEVPVIILKQMRDEIGREFSEEFIREVVAALATIGAKTGLMAEATVTRQQPERGPESSASLAINLQGIPSAESFGPLRMLSNPAESKKFWESDLGRSIIRYFYLILLVGGHLYEDHRADLKDQKIQDFMRLLAKQYEEFRLHEISPQFQPTAQPDPTPGSGAHEEGS